MQWTQVMTGGLLIAGLATGVQADVVGRAISEAGDPDLFNSFTADPDYTEPGDMFGIRSTSNPGTPGIPFNVADDSAGSFPPDALGVIDTASDNAPFFGVTDTVNGVGADTNVATWEFDIASVVSDLSVSIDMAGMGDFESSDFFDFTYSVDGGAFQPLFTSSVDEAGSLTYTMAGGADVSLDDPLSINGTVLNNEFSNFAESIGSLGGTLALRFSAETNGSEAFAFRNVLVEGVIPEPGSIALLGLGGLALLRRRR